MNRLRTTTLMVAAAVLTTCSAGDDALLIGREMGEVTNGIDHFGDERPSADLGTS